MYYIDSQRLLFKFDMRQVAEGRLTVPEFVIEGEKIGDSLEEISVDPVKGTVYTLRENGTVGIAGTSHSIPSSFRVHDS